MVKDIEIFETLTHAKEDCLSRENCAGIGVDTTNNGFATVDYPAVMYNAKHSNTYRKKWISMVLQSSQKHGK